MSAPTSTYNTAGNVLASQSLAAGANVTVDVDASAKFELGAEAKMTAGGTVAATNGLQLDAYEKFGPTGSEDICTVATFSRQTGNVAASAVASFPVALPCGKWRLKLTNLDASNAITVLITSRTIDGVA